MCSAKQILASTAAGMAPSVLCFLSRLRHGRVNQAVLGVNQPRVSPLHAHAHAQLVEMLATAPARPALTTPRGCLRLRTRSLSLRISSTAVPQQSCVTLKPSQRVLANECAGMKAEQSKQASSSSQHTRATTRNRQTATPRAPAHRPPPPGKPRPRAIPPPHAPHPPKHTHIYLNHGCEDP